MPTLLLIHSSGRVTRSVTRALARSFVHGFRRQCPDVVVVERDLGLQPPPSVDEGWIAAAFADPAARTEAMNDALELSEELLKELESADAVVLGCPVYNFGLPAALKAYFDQILRVGRSFEYEPAEASPYKPLLAPKSVVAIVSASDPEMHPGGRFAEQNVTEPHLKTLLAFIGLTDVSFVRVGEDPDSEPGPWSLAAAQHTLDRLADEVASLTCLGARTAEG